MSGASQLLRPVPNASRTKEKADSGNTSPRLSGHFQHGELRQRTDAGEADKKNKPKNQQLANASEAVCVCVSVEQRSLKASLKKARKKEEEEGGGGVTHRGARFGCTHPQ